MTNILSFLMDGATDPTAPVVWESGHWRSYGDLATRMRRFAALFRARANSGERPTVLLSGENSFDMIAAHLGALYAGAISIPVGALSDDAFRSVYEEARPSVVLAEPSLLDRVRALGIPEPLPLDVALDSELHTPAHVDPNDAAVIIYTSGSTGLPRGVMVSSRNISFNTEAILEAAPLSADDRAFTVLPFYYCYGLSVLYGHLRSRASLVLDRFVHLDKSLDVMAETAVTNFPGVPTTFQMLASRGALTSPRFPRLRHAMVAGGKIHEKTIRAILEALPDTKLHIRYGATEVTAAASFVPPERLVEKIGSIGRGLAGAPLTVEREDGTPVVPGSGEVGEIVVRGAHVTLGYFRATGEDLSFRGGAFHTGDLARVDGDGFIFHAGRQKDFVKTAGHRVAPQEVEMVLARIPEVEEVAVFGVPHPVRGEALVAAVVVRSGRECSIDALRLACAQHLPSFKVPVAFRVVAALPKTDRGKLDRRALADATEPPAK